MIKSVCNQWDALTLKKWQCVFCDFGGVSVIIIRKNFTDTRTHMTNIQFYKSAIDASECVSNAWELVKRNIGLYIGAGVVTVILIGCIPIVNFFLLGPMMGGFSYLVLRDMRNEPIDFGMLFKGFEKFLPLMIMGLIQAIPGIIFQVIQYSVDIAQLVGKQTGTSGDFYQSSPPLDGLAAGLTAGLVIIFVGYFIFQIIWNAALTFAIPLIIEHDVGIGEAIRLSFGAVFGNVGGLIVLYFWSILISLLGMLAICLGLLVAIPVIYAANVFAYRQVFPLLEDRFQSTPPPPETYGNFGQGV
jgi:hypothetical protein